ncbi:TetR/AcrR family transcriptional regulator [Seleniivibrio sp.]|uniref:TetR/AcrR family transcriptional regulator n=1 Tax=Seleniivibrio sp. TaxID=2898801 RepID=UPI0025D13BAC|nr:TetR/AcrR family transcriptional regulator [Seleniivibrio sp.]MCD8553857.1 TetR/AcrR family transcriptional regulator [Seleniivibrio sp.]
MDEMMKREIVTAVLSLIDKDAPITMEVVAKHSGVAKGTLYNYFANKEELFHYVHNEFIGPFTEEKRRIFKEDRDPMDNLCDFLDYTFKSFDRVSKYFMFMQKYRTVEEDIIEKNEIIITPLANAIKKGIENGQIVDADPIVLAEMIWGTIIGTFRSVMCQGIENYDMEKKKEDVIRLLKRLLIVE